MPFTDTELAETYARESSADWVTLVTVAHPDLSPDFRACSTHPDLTSRSNVFSFYALQFKPPDESHEGAPLGELRIDVVDQALVAELRALAPSPLTVTVELVVRARPDTVVRVWSLRGASARTSDEGLMTIPLSGPAIFDEPFPGQRFTPARFPGLFKGVRA